MAKLNSEKILERVAEYQIVTFDCFDTLITRKIRKGNDVLYLLDVLVSKKYHCPLHYFYKLRKRARHRLVRRNFKVDYTLDQIYQELAKISKFDQKQLDEIKKLEVQTDLKCVVPRYDVRDLYNAILARKQKIIIVSDMYYTKDIIAKLLTKCGYKGWTDILVSCEENSKKLTGSLWKKYYANNKSKSIHIGDNYLSDKFWPRHYHQPSIKLSSSYKLASTSRFINPKEDIASKVIQGLIYNKCLFNSPFASKNPCDSTFKYGYAILGPLFLTFFNWMKPYIRNKQLVFFSRDGYYLQKIYKDILNSSKNYPKNDNCYLYTSRTTVACANVTSFKDLKEITSLKTFQGHLKDFFLNRFGIVIKDEDDRYVNYVNKNYWVNKISKKYKSVILAKFKKDRKDYLTYVRQHVKKNAIIIDLGYIGTIQYYLNKLLNTNFAGLYFYKPPFNKPWRHNMVSRCCFGPSIDLHKWFIFRKTLEPFLTAPYGQFIRMNGKQPILQPCPYDNQHLKHLEQIYQGVKRFISDLANILPYDIANIKLDKKTAFNNLSKFNRLAMKGYVSQDLAEVLSNEDFLTNLKRKQNFKVKNH